MMCSPCSLPTSRSGQYAPGFPAESAVGSKYFTENGVGIQVRKSHTEGRTPKLDDTIQPNSSGQIWISVASTLLKQDQPIEATIHGSVGVIVEVDGMSASGLLNLQQPVMAHAAEPLLVQPSPQFHGIVVLAANATSGEPPEYRYQWDGDAGYKTVH